MPGLRQIAASVILVSMMVSTLTGCTTSAGCPSWAGYATPAEALEGATAVARGHVIDRVGSEPLNGGSANVWAVEVEEWVKGDGDSRIAVVSPPSQCGVSDDPYFGPDPFETAITFDAAIVFLTDTEAGWMAINPIHGVVEPSADGSLPASWPAAPVQGGR